MKVTLATSLAILASVEAISPSNSITASCKPDNTIEVVINHDIEASILSAKYGSCNLTSSGLSGFSDQDVKSWTGSLSPSRCDMDGKLRTLKYNQTAEFTVGRSAGDNKLVFSTYEIDTYCEYTATYTISFEYGSINAQTHDFDGSGGIIGLEFFMESMNEHFNETKVSSTQAGDLIYLTLQLNSTANDNFDYAKNMEADNGKAFVPTKCYVTDGNNKQFTLFDTSKNECTNEIIDLEIAYNNDDHMWQIAHILFLLDNEVSSVYTLTCDITVCDMSKGTACKEAYDCLIPPVVSECVPDPLFNFKNRRGKSFECDDTFSFIAGTFKDMGLWTDTILCSGSGFGGDNYKDSATGVQWRDACCPQNYDDTKDCVF